MRDRGLALRSAVATYDTTRRNCNCKPRRSVVFVVGESAGMRTSPMLVCCSGGGSQDIELVFEILGRPGRV